MDSLGQRVSIPTTAKARLRLVAVAVAGLAAATVPGAASAAAPTAVPGSAAHTSAPAAVAPPAGVPAVAPAAAPTPLPQLLLSPRDLANFRGGDWRVSSQRLTPTTTVEKLAGCSGKNTLSPSVRREMLTWDGFEWTPEGPAVDQRVVRYQPGRGAAVVDIFRATLARCPVRTFDEDYKERWRVVSDTRTTGTDRLIIRREPLAPHGPWRSHIVVTRVQDKVSLIYYWAGESSTGDPRGANTLASLSAKRLAN